MNIPSNTDLDNFTVTKAYARWAPVYDLVFGAVFERGRRAAAQNINVVSGLDVVCSWNLKYFAHRKLELGIDLPLIVR